MGTGESGSRTRHNRGHAVDDSGTVAASVGQKQDAIAKGKSAAAARVAGLTDAGAGRAVSIVRPLGVQVLRRGSFAWHGCLVGGSLATVSKCGAFRF